MSITGSAAAAAKSFQLCLTLCDLIDGSPPGSPIPGILQARTLEWVAISFSNAWKWKLKLKSLSHVWPSATSWTEAYQDPPSMGFSRQGYWSGVPLPSPVTGSVTYIKPGKHNNTSIRKAGGLLMRSTRLQTRPRVNGLTHWSGIHKAGDWCPLLTPALEQIHSQLESPQLAAPSAPRSMETGVIVTQTNSKGTSWVILESLPLPFSREDLGWSV